ncbi:hypothetical protein ACS0TY_011654 [Phlomoides rotata]
MREALGSIKAAAGVVVAFREIRERREMDDFNAIGDGTIGSQTDYDSEIQSLDDILISGGDNLIEIMVNSIYTNFENKMNDHGYLQERSIIAPTLDV